MKLYRIFTENVNYQDIIGYLQKRGIDATIINSVGLWQGTAEKSLCIEIVDVFHHEIDGLAYFIKKNNKQDKVLIQTINLENVQLI